jgi:predicted nucleic acid-binding Zn ribbon protein
MDAIKGDVFIEYIYIFKGTRWYVSTQKHTTVKDGYDRGTLFYYTKFEPVIVNLEYLKYKDKHEKHAEVKMISKIGDMLKGAGFSGDDVVIQGGNAKKTN